MWFAVLATVLLCVTPATYGFRDANLDKVLTRLWIMDRNRVAVGPALQLNWQGEVSRGDRVKDHSPAKLCNVTADKLNKSQMYIAFRALLDNYKAEVGVSEQETPTEKQEQETFLDSLMKSPIIEEVHKYLVSISLAPLSPRDFKELLRKLWFTLYRRSRSNDSSAFEHVFVGEIRKGKVSGFHNWVMFCEQEAKGDIDYHGFYRASNPEPSFKRSLRFTWKNREKSISTLLFGASVDFEVGLYTSIYLISKREFGNRRSWPNVQVSIGEDNIRVQCHDFRGQIGSCYVM